jgi:hypothetical protein
MMSPGNLLKHDVEHVFNVLIPGESGHAGSVPHDFQQAVKAGRYGAMRLLLGLLVGLQSGLQCGCIHKPVQMAAPADPAPYQQFVARNFDWSTVKRVLVMPLANQTAFAHASTELQANLAAELQRAGRFDVVVATQEDAGARAREIFSKGTFDELELLRIAREYDAQAVLFGQVTQYHPYAPPRVGISLVMVSPAEGVAIASADGLWDAREMTTARQAHGYLQQRLSWRQGLLGVDRALESPDVYQRFVCQQIATSLHPPETTAGLHPLEATADVVPPLSSVPAQLVPAGYEPSSAPPNVGFAPSPVANPYSR